MIGRCRDMRDTLTKRAGDYVHFKNGQCVLTEGERREEPAK